MKASRILRNPSYASVTRAVTCAVATFFGGAFGAELDTMPITYDVARNNIEFIGLYRPDPKEPRSGLNAEISARQDGIARMETELKKECGSGERAGRIVSGWQSSVRSQGSEIFADGSLRIFLSANFTSIFKRKKEQNPLAPLTADGRPILFTLGQLPLQAVQCGVVRFDYQGRILELIPQPTSGKDNAFKISLLIGASGVLKIPSPEGVIALEKSNVFEGTEKRLLLQSLPVLSTGSER